MPKYPKTQEYDVDAVKKTAEKMQFSTQHVRLVIRGKKKNALCKALYEMYKHGKDILINAAAEELDAQELATEN